jgi:putative ABC transport system substrate-binding protein
MGLVASLARPGGNVTGTTLDAGSLEMSKRLQLFREVLPHGSPIILIFSSSYPGVTHYVDQAREAARQLHIALEPIDVPTREDDVRSLIGARRVGGLMVGLDPVVAAQGKRIIEISLQKRWPTMFAGVVARRFVEAGGLMSYDANREEA